jgi:hypothetical protein
VSKKNKILNPVLSKYSSLYHPPTVMDPAEAPSNTSKYTSAFAESEDPPIATKVIVTGTAEKQTPDPEQKKSLCRRVGRRGRGKKSRPMGEKGVKGDVGSGVGLGE